MTEVEEISILGLDAEDLGNVETQQIEAQDIEGSDEIEIIDLGDPSGNHDFEVVTVDADTVKMFNSGSSNNKIRPSISSPPLSSASTSSRFKSAAPALLRNSRRFAPQEPNIRSSTSRLLPSTLLQQQVAQPTVKEEPQFLEITTENGESQYILLPPGADINQLLDGTIQIQPEPQQQQQQTILICDEETGATQYAQIVDDLEASYDDNGELVYHLDQSAFGDQEFKFEISNVVSRPKKPKKPKVSDASKKRPVTELKCMETDCRAVSFNVGELRKHLNAAHGLTFDEEIIMFPSDDDFKVWRETYERERMVSFIYRGGTKKISKDQAVTYLICHRSGHYKPTMANESLRKRKMKPQGSCKMGGYCTAGIKLLKNLDTGEVRMDICHTHYGHPLDNDAIPHLRVNAHLRKLILEKFQSGSTFNEVLEYIHHNPDGLEGLRLVDRRAVRNIYDTWRGTGKRPSRSKRESTSTTEEISEGFYAAAQHLLLSGHEERDDDDTTEAEEKDSAESNEDDETHETPSLIAVHNSEDESPSTSKKRQKRTVVTSEPATKEKPADKTSSDSQPSPRRPGRPAKSQKQSSKVDLTIVKQEPEDHQESSRSGRRIIKKRRDDDFAYDYDMPPPILVSSKDTSSPTVESISVEKNASPKKRGRKSNKEIEEAKEKEMPTLIKEEKEVAEASTSSQVKGKPSNMKSTGSITITKSTPPVRNYKKQHISAVKVNDSVAICIDKLQRSQSESGPTVLLYKEIGKMTTSFGNSTGMTFRENDFYVILQTPVQRQILLMFPNLISIDIMEGKSEYSELSVIYLAVMDEYREPIPVAWMICDNFEPRSIKNFCLAMKHACKKLDTKILMTPRDTDYHHFWSMVFENNPTSLQNELDARRDLRMLLNNHFSTDQDKTTVWSYIELLLTAKTLKKFQESYKKMQSNITELNIGNNFLRTFDKQWISVKEEWSTYKRMNCSVNIVFAADSFSRLKKFISFKGTKKLTSDIDQILKIGYDKCFLRQKGDQKITSLLDDIQSKHLASLDEHFKPAISFNNDDFSWSITLDENGEDKTYHVYDTRSPCHCKEICRDCNICMHVYMCTCSEFTSNLMMCPHIHFVHSYRQEIGALISMGDLIGIESVGDDESQEQNDEEQHQIMEVTDETPNANNEVSEEENQQEEDSVMPTISIVTDNEKEDDQNEDENENDDEKSEDEEPTPIKSPAGRRGRKPQTKPIVPTPPTKKDNRRVSTRMQKRKASDEKEDEDTKVPEAKKTKAGRPTRSDNAGAKKKEDAKPSTSTTITTRTRSSRNK